MKIRTLIIDDEPIALEKLKSYVSKTPFLELVGECHSAVDAAGIVASGGIDVIFTDISMPDIDGMEFVASLSTPPMVVFISAFTNYAVESYKLSAVDYLLKPYGFADFQRAANKVLQNYLSRQKTVSEPSISTAPADSIFVKIDYRYIRLELHNILYIKGFGEYLQIFLEGDENPVVTLSSFSAMRQRLTPDFLQVHRSYVVNMNRVSRIEKSRVVIGEVCIPVGDSYRGGLMDYLSGHSVGSNSKQ